MAGEAGWVGWENAPSHYKGAGGIENFNVWDEYQMDPYTANAFKYLARWDKKGAPFQDLNKALHYVEEALTRHEAGMWDTRRAATPPNLTARKVINAFRLSGLVELAVECLLEWRTRPLYAESESALIACKFYIGLAVRDLEAKEGSCTST